MLCALTGAHSVALADTQPDEEEISELVVTATRIARSPGDVPASVSVLSGDELQHARQQLGLDEALARVPGVYFQNRYNFAQDLRIAIRGFGARSNFGVRGIKILIDDIPETLADGQGQVDSIDLASVGQVEVLRGPASALYGNAAGGVISIQSEVGALQPYAEARMAFGDYGFRKQQFKTGGAVGGMNYLLSISDLQIDGYRDHSAARNKQFNSRFRFDVSDNGELSLAISATDQPLSNDPGGLTSAQVLENPRGASSRNISFDAGEALDQQKLGASYKHRFANGDVMTARNYYLFRNFQNRLPFAAGGAVTIDRFFAGGGLSYSRSFRLGEFQHRLIVGIDYDRQDDERQRYDNLAGAQGPLTFDQTERATSTGIFVQDELRLSDALAVTVGLRYDSVDFAVADDFLVDGDDSGARSIDDVSPSIGFVFKLNSEHSLYGSFATAFETPTFTEFANPDGSGGFNPALAPQLSTSFELGLRGSISETGQYEIVAFNIDVDDELVPFEIAASPGRNYFANVAKSSRQGLELAVRSEPLPGLSLSLAYTFSDFTFDTFIDDSGSDFSGNRIPGIPKTFAHADIAYTHDSGFMIALDAMYSDSIFAENANLASVNGATVANLRLAFLQETARLDIEPFIGVNNLTDTAYTSNTRINAFGGRYFEPGPERNVYGGVLVRYRFTQ